jgi:hypothetical protein
MTKTKVAAYEARARRDTTARQERVLVTLP